MTITPVRFFEISVTNLSELLAQQSGKQTDTDTELNYAPWGAKDSGGLISKFLEKDKRAVVSELVATGNITSGRALVVPASGTNLENGTALLNALAAAKAGTYPAPSVPSSTNPTFIFTHGGTFDLGASQLVLDTDHIYIISGTPARRLSKSSGSSFSSAISLAGTNITSTNATSTISITAESGLINVNGRNTNGAPAFYTDGDSKKIFLFGCSGESTNAKTLDKGSSFTTSVLCENSHFETGATGGGGLIMKGSSAYGGTSFSAALNQSVDLDDCIIKFETNISVPNGFVCKNSKLSGSFDIGLTTGFERTILDSEINCASINVASGVSDDVNFTNNIIVVSTVPVWTPGIFKNNIVTSTATSGTSTLMLPSQTALDTEVIVQNNNIVSGDETYSISAFAVGAKPSVVDGNVFSKAIDGANINYNGNNFVEDVFSTSLTTENINIPDISTDKPVKDKISNLLNDHIGRGVVSGGLVTPNATNPTTEVDITSGEVWLSENALPGYSSGFLDFDAATLTVTQGVPNFIYVQWTAGGATCGISVDPTLISYVENTAVLEIVFPDGDEIHITTVQNGWQAFFTAIDRRFIEKAVGMGNPFLEWHYGVTIGTTGARYVTLTEGVFWAGMRRIASPDFNTDTGGDTMFSFYRDGVGGHTKTASLTQLDNANYDNGTGTLTALGSGKYTNRWMFLDYNTDNISWVYDTNQYTSITGAESATVPTDLPDYISGFSIFIGRVTVQQGSDTTLVDTAFGGGIQTSPVTSHTELSNVNTDAEVQHMTSAEKTAVSSITANGEQAVYNISGSVNLGNGIARQTLSTKNDDIMLRMISSDDGETETDYIQLGSTGVDDLAIQGQYIGADGTTIDLNATGALNLTGSPVSINGVSQTPNQITTSDNGTEPVYSNDEAEHVLNGSGDNYKVLFKDSESGKLWTVGQSKTVFNNSSEVAIVTDDNASFCEFLVPRATATVKCAVDGIGTTEFEYVDNAETLPDSVCQRDYEDWSQHRSNVNYNMTQYTFLGGSTSVNPGATPGAFGGAARMQTGTTDASGEAIQCTDRSYIAVGSGAVLIDCRLSVNDLGVNPDEFVGYFGMFGSLSGGSVGSAPASGFRIAFDTLSDGVNWLAAAFNASTEYNGTSYTSVPVVVDTMYRGTIVIKSDGSKANYYINGVRIAEILDTLPDVLPNGTFKYGAGVESTGTGSTVDRITFEDMHLTHRNIEGGR